MASRSGRIMPFMKASGETTKLVAEALSGMPKETCMSVSSKKIKQTGLGSTLISMEVSTLASGSTMCKRGKGKKFGLMELSTWASTRMGKSMGMEFTSGRTEVNLKATGKTTKSLAMGCITGMMAEFTKVIGFKTICMAMESTNGLMGACMKEITQTTKRMGMGSTPTRMDVVTRANGATESSTEKDCSLLPKEYSAKESGRMGSAYSGWMRSTQSTPPGLKAMSKSASDQISYNE